ncbi:16S rRNA (cytidine(1402)-2'-O)-methyltransferase [Peptoniphilus raoultii]|uniref:16S rRNA (cytidine(1402)-2'-O)-methyltransferase n=1 Tax=Peptoniphilus raoultii TaxID=1776387 RepID=UPI0008DB33B4|nr:16S rRNA (cytidine(1402)-2'-O)-methyltransferase [Peptoniphilus raoultii]
MIYFCPTPIGNLEDITLRTLRVLRESDIIFAEDTRVTLKLLNHYDIKKKLYSYQKFNESEVSEDIIKYNEDGLNICLVTDAGMPGISDPGEVLVKKLIEENIDFRVLPGPNAALTALVGSGLNTENFYFKGFTSPKSSARKKELEAIKDLKATIIFYEAPHRVLDFLRDLLEIFGDREISISRELTKIYEETIRGKISEILQGNLKVKGEFVIICHGKEDEEIKLDIEDLLREKILKGISKSQAVKEIVKEYNLSKNYIYKESLKLDV